jgi:hypothetical protein
LLRKTLSPLVICQRGYLIPCQCSCCSQGGCAQKLVHKFSYLVRIEDDDPKLSGCFWRLATTRGSLRGFPRGFLNACVSLSEFCKSFVVPRQSAFGGLCFTCRETVRSSTGSSLLSSISSESSIQVEHFFVQDNRVVFFAGILFVSRLEMEGAGNG